MQFNDIIVWRRCWVFIAPLNAAAPASSNTADGRWKNESGSNNIGRAIRSRAGCFFTPVQTRRCRFYYRKLQMFLPLQMNHMGKMSNAQTPHLPICEFITFDCEEWQQYFVAVSNIQLLKSRFFSKSPHYFSYI